MALGSLQQEQNPNPVDAYMGSGASNTPGGQAFGSPGGPSLGSGAGAATPVSRPANGQIYGSADSMASRFGGGSARNSIMNQIMSMFGPDQAGLRNQGQGIMDQIGLTQQRTGTNADFLRQNYGLDLRSLGLDQASLGIDRQGANRAYQSTFEQERIARALAANQAKALGQQYTEGTQSAQSEATAAGAFSAPGIRTGMKNLFANLGIGVQKNDLGLQSDLLGIRNTRASAQDQQRQLDVQSQRLGLNRDQLSAQLQQGLTNNGLDGLMSVNDLMGALSSNNMQQAAIARQILDQLLGFSQR